MKSRGPLPPAPMVAKKPEEQVGLIQGQMPGSINEWYISQALDHYEIPYIYQYNLGAGIRGGQVVDFVVMRPKAIPVFIQGAYWHNIRTEPEDILKQSAAEHYFRTPPVLIMEEESNSYTVALRTVRKEFL